MRNKNAAVVKNSLCYNRSIGTIEFLSEDMTNMNTIVLLGYGHTVCDERWGMRGEVADFCRMYYVLDGTCHYKDAKNDLTLAKGHLYLLPQYMEYDLSQEISDPFFVLWQHIGAVGCSVRELVDVEIREKSAQWHSLRALEQLTRGELIERAANEPLERKQQITQLLSTLISLIDGEGQPLFCRLDTRLSKTWRYIQSTDIAQVTIGGMVAASNLERSYFSRLFRAQIGVSPQEWLIMARMTQAARLLAEGMTVADTAAQVGYSDSKAFSRAFSQRMKRSPSAYHKSHILQP